MLKTLMLVQGGALIGLFTLIGNSGGLVPDYGLIWWGFACFVLGLVSILVAYVGAFFSQKYFYEQCMFEVWNLEDLLVSGEMENHAALTAFKRGQWAFRGGTGCAALSVLAFIAGAFFALASVLPA